MKAYLDNNVISAIAKDDTPTESDALGQLLKAHEQGKVDLVTSRLTLDEIKHYQGPRSVEWIFRLFAKVPVVRWDEALTYSGYDQRPSITGPMVQKLALHEALRALALDPVDAQHVFVAATNQCDAFLTCDKGILRLSGAIGKLRDGPVVQKPSEFIASRGW